MADQRISGWNEVSQRGDIDDFYNLIKNDDVKLLEHIDELPFVHTPLHISASAGHIEFSIEMMKLKPFFISKPNPDGHTPIYLALLHGHTEMVRQLLQHNADLVRVKGKKCMTPLHDAATKIGREGLTPPHYEAKTKDYLALLENFLSVCPDSIADVTVQSETTLHIALKHNNLEAFKFLVGWLLRKSPDWRKILKQKDVKGDTVLHIAVSRNQTLAVSHLLHWWFGRFVNINEKNLEGKTALDILEGQRRQGVDNIEMRVILESAGALTAPSLPTVTSSYANYLRLPGICEATKIIFIRNERLKSMSDGKRNALLVVAALLVTVSYQAAITPPGGLWQDDLFAANTTDVLRRSSDDLYKLNITAPHRAGSATARGTYPFSIFMVFNSVIFYSSIVVIFVLVPPGELVGLCLAIYSLILIWSYSCSIRITTQSSGLSVLGFVVPFIIFITFVVQGIAFVGSFYLLNLIRKEKLKKKYSRA